jgi:hypothetical protein
VLVALRAQRCGSLEGTSGGRIPCPTACSFRRRFEGCGDGLIWLQGDRSVMPRASVWIGLKCLGQSQMRLATF